VLAYCCTCLRPSLFPLSLQLSTRATFFLTVLLRSRPLPHSEEGRPSETKLSFGVVQRKRMILTLRFERKRESGD